MTSTRPPSLDTLNRILRARVERLPETLIGGLPGMVNLNSVTLIVLDSEMDRKGG